MTQEPDARHHARLLDWLSVQVQIHSSYEGSADWKYCCTEELVLALGRWGVPSPLPSGRPRGAERMCYANASGYSEAHGLTYVEGYGLTTVGFVFAHAWCVDGDGTVHDPTWPDGIGIAYLGLPFSANYIREVEGELGDARLVHGSHLDGHRILREGLPAEAIVPSGEPVSTSTAGVASSSSSTSFG